MNKEQIKKFLHKPGIQCEVKNELRFAAIIDEKLTNGTFDRVVFYPNLSSPEKVEIYDFKTDAVYSDEEINSAVEKYKLQLGCYKNAIVKGYNLNKNNVKVNIVFTAPGIITGI